MNTSGSPAAATQPRATRAWCRDGKIWVELTDRRCVGAPTDKFPQLRDATEDLLSKIRLEARGRALRWEELDEDLTVDGIVAGRWPDP